MPFSTHHALSESQKRMYALEKEENFRWVARLLSSCPPPSRLTLTPAQRVPASLQQSISELGQFAELVNGAIDVDFVWQNLEQLIRPDYPLEGYDAVRKSRLLRMFHGRVANQRGYIVHRPETRQLVVAFSGTSSFMQALQDLDARLVSVAALKTVGGYDGPPARVHAGFWRLYQGVKDAAIEGLEEYLKTVEVDELVVVGHSLGAAISALLVLDLLQSQFAFLPDSLKLRLLTFGSPRVGDAGLKELYTYLVAEHHRKRGETAFEAHAVKGYNDGVPCLPPKRLGYRHLHSTPLYLHHGFLYQIPEGFEEYSEFTIEAEAGEAPPPDYPLGGHNYYNRDMAKAFRRLGWLNTLTLGEVDWEQRYLRKLEKEEGRKQ